jgi:diphthamide synthase (EF-2-diphthine--ammonia ligase)
VSTPILLAWSGGKDSTLVLERLLDDAQWRVAGLLTTVTSGYDRIAIHGVRRSILHRQARALGLPLIEAEMNARFCGRSFDAALLAELPSSCDPCGENGEFHTCVHAGPLFTQAIPLVRGKRVFRDERFQYIDLIDESTQQA